MKQRKAARLSDILAASSAPAFGSRKKRHSGCSPSVGVPPRFFTASVARSKRERPRPMSNSKTADEVQQNNRDWTKSSGAKADVQQPFPTADAKQPRFRTEFLGPNGGAEPRRE